MVTLVFTALVTIKVWSTPLPADIPVYGKLVNYGSQSVVEANARWRGYDLSPYHERCGGALLSPSDLGKVFWVRVDEDWVGPCLSVDAAARADFALLAGEWRDIVEVGGVLPDRLGFEYGAWGHVYVGLCPPEQVSREHIYDPVLAYDWHSQEPHVSFYPYPQQQYPVDCAPERRREVGLCTSGCIGQSAPAPTSGQGWTTISPVQTN